MTIRRAVTHFRTTVAAGLLLGAALVAVPSPAGASPAGASPAAAAGTGVGRYVALTPTRVLDTRGSSPIGPGGTRTVDFSGDLPDLVVAAVVLNVTVVNATQPGYVTAYPAGTTRPTTSSLNHRAGETRANSVTVALPASAANQRVTFFHDAGTTDLVVDLSGYYVGTAADPATSSSYYSLASPIRTFDSRQLGVGGPLGAGQSRTIQRAFGIGGTTISGVRAVAVTVTAVAPHGEGYLRAWNGDPDAVPTASTVNFTVGQTVPNFAVVAVTCVNAPTCSTFSFAVGNYISPATDILVDVVGIYARAGQPGAAAFVPTTPRRLVDTRLGLGFGRLGPGGSGATSVGSGLARATAANLNVTSVAPTVGTYLTVYPDGASRPVASNLNPVAGETASDAVQTALSATQRFRVYNANGSTGVVVDLMGTFQQEV